MTFSELPELPPTLIQDKDMAECMAYASAEYEECAAISARKIGNLTVQINMQRHNVIYNGADETVLQSISRDLEKEREVYRGASFAADDATDAVERSYSEIKS